jgi:hypothetical protein
VKRRGFLALPALLAVPYLPAGAAPAAPIEVPAVVASATQYFSVREAYRAALAKWMSDRMDSQITEALNVGHHGG